MSTYNAIRIYWLYLYDLLRSMSQHVRLMRWPSLFFGSSQLSARAWRVQDFAVMSICWSSKSQSLFVEWFQYSQITIFTYFSTSQSFATNGYKWKMWKSSRNKIREPDASHQHSLPARCMAILPSTLCTWENLIQNDTNIVKTYWLAQKCFLKSYQKLSRIQVFPG